MATPLVTGRRPQSLVTTSSIDVLDKLLEILFRRQLDASGGAYRNAAVAEHEAFVRVGYDKLGALDSCGIGWTGLENTGFAEDLAVAATVADIRVDHGKPWNIFSRSKQPLFAFP